MFIYIYIHIYIIPAGSRWGLAQNVAVTSFMEPGLDQPPPCPPLGKDINIFSQRLRAVYFIKYQFIKNIKKQQNTLKNIKKQHSFDQYVCNNNAKITGKLNHYIF